MNDEQIELIEKALRNGFGFTRGCMIAGLSVEGISDLIKKDFPLRKKMKGAILEGQKDLLDEIDKLRSSRISEWNQKKILLNDFVSRLVLWGDYSESIGNPRITNEHICKAVGMYKTIYEAATALGVGYNALMDNIQSDQDLFLYMTERNLI